MRRSFAFKITLLVLLWLLLAIACQQVPGTVFWPTIFGAITTPLALLLTGLLVLYWLRRNWRVALLPGLALGLCWPHVQRGLALHPLHTPPSAQLQVKSAKGNIPASTFFTPQAPDELLLLSANVRIFNVYGQLRDPNFASSKGFIRWLSQSPADVLCLQEYYHEPRGSQENGSVFKASAYIGPQSGRHPFVSKTLTNRIGAEFGLAIFSRFPIVRRGTIRFARSSHNHAMWADLARPATPGRRADTIRVFNLHLQSMSLEENDIVAAAGSKKGFQQKGRNLLRRFRNGAVARGTQVDTVLARIARSPYPVLLAGDLNDLPYSYTYDQLADHLQNAWATAGTGIGATYNGRLPALRIDNQFASRHWQVLGCRVHKEILWSDHFPVEALYRISVSSEQ
ncbi:endonuclease/exonuclease/phosphatase family protein [Hymenobacter saemangeumensis]|uniref:Endonuclease/exonuclease/phosphatase family protein n=1 Tax=Hymenobacter saemangeumensis TaxID=1084522 RepID=A0ABP8I3R7_9BACT